MDIEIVHSRENETRPLCRVQRIAQNFNILAFISTFATSLGHESGGQAGWLAGISSDTPASPFRVHMLEIVIVYLTFFTSFSN